MNMNKRRGSQGRSLKNIRLNNRGQVTMFIVIAIIIVAIILFSYFYLAPKFSSLSENRPYLEKCISDDLIKQVDKLSLNAGIVNPQFTSMYLDENYTFICYTNEYYKPCVVQHPFLKDSFEKSLYTAMKPTIERCYNEAVEELRAQGNDVTTGNIKSSIELNPNGVTVKIEAPTVISTDGASASFKEFRVNIYSQIYTIIMIANSILQYESSYGDSDTSSFMFYYPDLTVQKIRRDDNVKLYIITDKKDIKYRFASRSYAWPPGYGKTFDQ